MRERDIKSQNSSQKKAIFFNPSKFVNEFQRETQFEFQRNKSQHLAFSKIRIFIKISFNVVHFLKLHQNKFKSSYIGLVEIRYMNEKHCVIEET